MSAIAEREKARQGVRTDCGLAITALTAAAERVIAARAHLPESAQPLVTAIRDEIGDIIRDVTALREMGLSREG